MVPLRRMVYLVLGSCVALGLGWCAEAEKVGGKGVTNRFIAFLGSNDASTES